MDNDKGDLFACDGLRLSVGPNSKFGPNTEYIRFLKMYRIPNIEYIQFLKNDRIRIPNSAIRT